MGLGSGKTCSSKAVAAAILLKQKKVIILLPASLLRASCITDQFMWELIVFQSGGIGRSMEHISEIEALQRPLTMETGGLLLMDLLWSDPTENDRVEGVHPNARGPGLVRHRTPVRTRY